MCVSMGAEKHSQRSYTSSAYWVEHKQCDSEKLQINNSWPEHTRVILEDGRGFKGSTAMLKYQGTMAVTFIY